MKRLRVILGTLFAAFFSFPSTVHAQFKEWKDTPGCIATTKDAAGNVISEVATLKCIPVVFENIIRAALMFAGIIALIFIILSGIKLITSGGDPKAVAGAKQTLTFAIIGLAVVLLSFFIIGMIGYITGVNCITSVGLDNCQ